MKTRKVTLLSSALFLSMGLQAKRESANYSIGPETFAPLAGDANSSNYAQFSAVEPLSGLSVKDLPDFKNFTGFIGQLPALDQDGDGISDVNEVALGTDKTDPDTDGDGLTDGEEVALGTDPLSADSDGDGYSDFAEVDANTNPSVAGSNPNRAPTLIELNGSTVLENQPLETLVGHFSATDPDANQSLTLSIVQGVGNASLFFLDGNNGLRTASIFDFEASPNTLTLSVRASDEYNASIDQTFVIEVINENESLTLSGIENQTMLNVSVPENSQAVHLFPTFDNENHPFILEDGSFDLAKLENFTNRVNHSYQSTSSGENGFSGWNALKTDILQYAYNPESHNITNLPPSDGWIVNYAGYSQVNFSAAYMGSDELTINGRPHPVEVFELGVSATAPHFDAAEISENISSKVYISRKFGVVGWRTTHTAQMSAAGGGSDPALDSSLLSSVVESQVDQLGGLGAQDPDGGEITWSLNNSPDSQNFTLETSPLKIFFTNAPDFEDPKDADYDNVYQFTLIASDGTHSKEVALSVSVLDDLSDNPTEEPVDQNGTEPVDQNETTEPINPPVDHNDTHQPVPGPIDQNQTTEEPVDPVVDQNETVPTDHNQSIEPEQPDLAPPSLAGLKFRYNETELTNGQPVNYGWSEGRFNQEEFVEWDEDEQTLSHTPYVYAKINRKAAYFILSEEGGGEITVNLVFDSNRSGNGTWTETDGEEDFYGTLEFEISPTGAEGEPVQPPVDHHETQQPGPGPIDQNGTDVPPIYPPVDQNGTEPVDHNDTQQPGPGPIDQNGTDVPPIYPPVDHNDSISIPGPDQNETIEPQLPPVRLAEVITMTVVAEKSGIVRAVGRVASDGGEAPSKFGFAVSDQILFDENDQNIRYYEGKGFGFIFEVAISDLQAGKTHYIRSFAQNSAGIIFGSVKRIKLETEYVAPFDGLEVANGWYRSPWFGMFKKANSNWVFHPELGWIYHGDDHSNGTWVWIESFGWSWSRGDLWPYLWVSSKSDWVYYLGTHGGIPTFWDYTDQSIIRW